MQKISTILIFLLSLTMVSAQDSSFYNLTAHDIDGNPVNLESFKGQKIMIVNTASKCGFTKQYADLETLYKNYKEKGFLILGFPANNFMKQEPGTNEEIEQFCSINYGVTFLMMEKISVKGDDQHTVYAWLTQKAKNGVKDSKVKWNFQKYLISENGELVDILSSSTQPMDKKIIQWLENSSEKTP